MIIRRRILVYFRGGLRARFILIAGIRQLNRIGSVTLARMKWTVLTLSLIHIYDGTNGQIGPQALKAVYDVARKAAMDVVTGQMRDGGLFSGGGR